MSDLSNITSLTGLTIESDQTLGTNNPNATFAIPNLTTLQRDSLKNVTPYIAVTGQPAVTVKPGTEIFNISTGFAQVFQKGVWQNISTTSSIATGVGLTNGTPFTIPSGTNADVEIAANAVNGFMYYNISSNTIRAYVNGAWGTITFAADG
jgi:hypothetical protein